ncbi:MAG: TonB-dependent receptor [Tannerella sp.]|jgi:hypothetical protein|nr:TonB-dependent receptor [Tannerella sp.]
MVMRKIQMVMITAFLLGMSMPGFAQEPDKNKEEAENERADRQQNLNREMTLEREYDPIVQDAVKINTLPVVREVNISKRPIVYSDYAVPVSTTGKEVNVLPAATFMTEVGHDKRNGYLHFAGGMLMNFNGDFGYHLLNTGRDKLGIFFSHRSTNGDVKFQADSLGTRKAKLNENLGGLDFKHRFDVATLSLGGNFGYSAFNYYGIPAAIDGAPAVAGDSATNQGNRYINVYAGIASGETSSPGYHVDVDYKNFNQKYALGKFSAGMTENNIGLNLGLNSPVNNGQRFGVDLKMNMLVYTAPALTDYQLLAYPPFTVDSVAFDNRYEVTLNPYYRLENDNLKLLLGVNFMLVSRDETDVFVSPNIALDVPVATRSLFYINLGGGIESNTMYELSRLNRYINPAVAPEASRTWADTKLGIRSSASAGLWFDLFAGYKYTESDVFYNPSSSRIENGFNNVSTVFQPVTQRIQAGATLKYDHKHVFDFYLKGLYNYYTFKRPDAQENGFAPAVLPDENDEIEAYGKPVLTINAGVNVRPLKPLVLSLDYSMASGMYAYVNKENVKMNTVNDLSLRATWKFTDSFGIYAQFNNLLFQRQELYYGYPLQPFTAMAGFNVNF